MINDLQHRHFPSERDCPILITSLLNYTVLSNLLLKPLIRAPFVVSLSFTLNITIMICAQDLLLVRYSSSSCALPCHSNQPLRTRPRRMLISRLYCKLPARHPSPSLWSWGICCRGCDRMSDPLRRLARCQQWSGRMRWCAVIWWAFHSIYSWNNINGTVRFKIDGIVISLIILIAGSEPSQCSTEPNSKSLPNVSPRSHIPNHSALNSPAFRTRPTTRSHR
jgi:hypothetical protein